MVVKHQQGINGQGSKKQSNRRFRPTSPAVKKQSDSNVPGVERKTEVNTKTWSRSPGIPKLGKEYHKSTIIVTTKAPFTEHLPRALLLPAIL